MKKRDDTCPGGTGTTIGGSAPCCSCLFPGNGISLPSGRLILAAADRNHSTGDAESVAAPSGTGAFSSGPACGAGTFASSGSAPGVGAASSFLSMFCTVCGTDALSAPVSGTDPSSGAVSPPVPSASVLSKFANPVNRSPSNASSASVRSSVPQVSRACASVSSVTAWMIG